MGERWEEWRLFTEDETYVEHVLGSMHGATRSVLDRRHHGRFSEMYTFYEWHMITVTASHVLQNGATIPIRRKPPIDFPGISILADAATASGTTRRLLGGSGVEPRVQAVRRGVRQYYGRPRQEAHPPALAHGNAGLDAS